jgi:antitoxin VapB
LIDIIALSGNAMAATAKIFMHGRSPGRTPAERVSFAGKEVRVSKVGDKVIFEPLEKEPFDIEHWRAELVAAGAKKFLPEGLPEHELAAHDDDISFD